MFAGRYEQHVLLLVICMNVMFVPGMSQVVNLKIYQHNVSHPKVMPNSLRLDQNLVKHLGLNVGADFKQVVLQNRFEFSNRNLLIKSLLHKDYQTKKRGQLKDSFDPLDQIGNTVLEYMIKRVLIMNSQSNLDGPTLNKMASALLKADTVAFIAIKNKLDNYIFIDQAHVTNNSQTAKFKEAVKGLNSYQDLVGRVTDAKERLPSGSFLHRMMKALIGAVYVDTGYDIQKTNDVIMPMFNVEVNQVYNKVLNGKDVI